MPYDKDLRDLLKAAKKVAKPLAETVEKRKQTGQQTDVRPNEQTSAAS